MSQIKPQLRNLIIYQAGFTLPAELNNNKENDVEDEEMEVEGEDDGNDDFQERPEKIVTFANITVNLPR